MPRVVAQRSDFVGAHRVLASAAGMANEPHIAAAALQKLRRAQPNISLAWIADYMPIKLDADREHYLEGFRRAGLIRISWPRLSWPAPRALRPERPLPCELGLRNRRPQSRFGEQLLDIGLVVAVTAMPFQR